ncbi:MAG: FAD-dependent monooxygenase [Rhizobiaceae bacterium]|nr:FAD-dependent monooxygenase [Rhizobiaceae bacterium]
MRVLDIAVVGAGPAGLAVALYLARAGHRVTIFERFEKPAPVGSGLILQPTGLAVLHDLGLFSEILALGATIERLRGTDARSGRTVLDVRYDALPGGRFGLAVHRAALFGVLFRAARRQGIAIETGTEIGAMDVTGGRAAPITTEGRVAGRFDLIIDASGARSRLKRFARKPSDPRPLAYGAFWASLPWRGDGFDAHALVQRYSRASVMIGVLPIGRPDPESGPMAAFFWSIKPDDVQKVRAAGLSAWKDRVAGFWPDCAAYLDQIGSFDDLTLARYGHHTLARPVGLRLAVIGDGAHSTSPQLGQGANMALLDARALAHALATTEDVDAALSAYVRMRRRHVRVFQAMSWMFTPFYQSDSRVLPFLRDRLVATVARVEPAQKFLASMVAGTVIDPFERIGLTEPSWEGMSGT